MRLVQRTLPIALARPFVEQFVPEGTKVGIVTVESQILEDAWAGNQDVIAWLLNKKKKWSLRLKKFA